MMRIVLSGKKTLMGDEFKLFSAAFSLTKALKTNDPVSETIQLNDA